MKISHFEGTVPGPFENAVIPNLNRFAVPYDNFITTPFPLSVPRELGPGLLAYRSNKH
jgi:hypothetical protein